jgi:serine palmitoyltransferase
LRKNGVAATPFSKPAVPMWQSRVRIGLSAEFTDDHVNQLLDALISSCAKTNVLRSGKRCMVCWKSHEPRTSFQSTFDHSGLEMESNDALRYLYKLIEVQRAQLVAQQAFIKSSNERLAVPTSRQVIDAGQLARKKYGLGSGSSRWILGTYPPHLEVEQLVCDMTHQPAAMVYTNTEAGLMSTCAALCRPIKGCKSHLILLPKTAPQPVLDGYQAAPLRYGTKRADYSDLDDLLRILGALTNAQRRETHITLVLQAQEDLAAFADRLTAMRSLFGGMTLLVDSTYSLPTDTTSICQLATRLDARILIFSSFYHTLNGLNGAFLAGNKILIEELRYTSRCYMFTAAPAPYMMGMVAEALKERRMGSNRTSRYLDRGREFQRV